MKSRSNTKKRKQRKTNTLPSGGALLHGRLGWRLREWQSMTGQSKATVWRRIRAGDLRVIKHGRIPIVPRTEAVRLGFLDA